MSEVAIKPKTTSESDEFSDNLPDESNAVFETAEFVKTATSSSHHDSEYDTASDTATSEGDDLQDDDEDEDEEEEEDEFEDEEGIDGHNNDENGIVLDLERQRGDGEEQDAEKKKVDDDEDRSNPQYIPKRGNFYEHDDRTADEPEDTKKSTESDELKAESSAQTPKKPSKKNNVASDRWSHDRYDEGEQAPKSRAELVNSYGYDIRNEDGPPRARRRRRYGRGPSKYTRKWEDETAYAKMQQRTKSPRPEDFPELGTKSGSNKYFKEEKENNRDDSGNRRKFTNRSPSRKVSDPNRSQNYQKSSMSDDRYEHKRSQPNDRYDGGNRSQNQSDRFDENRYDDDSHQQQHQPQQHQNDRFRQRQQNDRSLDQNRSQNDKYDDGGKFYTSDGKNDRSWDRKNRGSTGFRTGKNTIEFINQNRNKSMDGSTSTNLGGGRSFGPPNPFRAQYEYPEKQVVQETMNFSNSNMLDGNSLDYGQVNRNKDSERPAERPITGRTQGPLRSQNTVNPSTNLQLNSSHKAQVQIGHIPQSVHPQSSTISQQQQQPAPQSQQPPPQPPQISQAQQQPTTLMSSDASRSTKRYSTLRQRTNIEATQQIVANLTLHDQQQLMLQDATLLLQMQQNKESLQLQQNISLQNPSSSYTPQQIPLQLQPDYSGQIPTKSTAAPQPSPQQLLLAQPSNQSSTATQQFQAAYFSPSEFAPQAGPPGQTIPPTPPNSQLMSGPTQQYPAQFNTPTAPYLQAPPPATYIQPPSNPQALLNFVPTIPPTQPPAQFQPVHPPVQPFPAYPNVPNYNTVSSGITYYAPQTQPPPRPILSQRRPTNAIPILAPPERGGGKGRGRTINQQFDEFDEEPKTNLTAAPIGSPENIDHILDNMFVQRPPYQPPTRKSSSPSPEANKTTAPGSSAVVAAVVTSSSASPVAASAPLSSEPETVHTTASMPFENQSTTSQLDYVDVGVSKLSVSDDISSAPIITDNTTASDQAHFLINAPEITEQIG